MDFTKGEGNKRPRKRNKKPKPDGDLQLLSTLSNHQTEGDTNLSSALGEYADAGSSDSDCYIDPILKEQPGSSPRSGKLPLPNTPRISRSAPYPGSPGIPHANLSPISQHTVASGIFSYGNIPDFDRTMLNAPLASTFDTTVGLSLPPSASALQMQFDPASESDIFVGDPVDYTEPGYTP